MDDAAETAARSEGDGHGHGASHRSRWPIVAAAGAATLYLGAGLLLAGGGLLPPLPLYGVAGAGLVVLLAGLAGWAAEAFGVDVHGGRDYSRRYVGGMVLFLLSDLATFAAGFVYYGFVRAGPWPPGELPPLVGSLLLVNTAVLVASSGTVHAAHSALESGRQRRFRRWLAVTVGLGVVFLAGQAVEYYEFVTAEGFTLSSGVYASAFFGLTGLHGLHVSLGVVLLATLLWRARRGLYTAERDTAVRTVTLYWHFVDVVWLFLVVVLYVGAVVGG